MAEQAARATIGDAWVSWRLAKPRSLWADAAHTFSRNKAAMAGLMVAIIVFLVAIFAPLIAPYDYTAQDYQHLREPPSRAHIMGTDVLGRDLFSRTIMGIRTAVLVATIITLTTTVVGVVVGSMGAFLGGWVDALLVWLIDGLMNFPSMWLAAFISVSTRPTVGRLAAKLFEWTGWPIWENTVVFDYLVVITGLSLFWWAGLARLVRGQVLSLREKEFIEAQRAIGASAWWITKRHLVPNVLGQVIVHMSTGFGGAMLVESALSFLGIGIRPPGASLGQMIYAGSALWRSDPHLVAMPGITLAVIVLAFVFVGDGLNDALNPRARER
jgi:peptide/nickel transport system permease protein